MKKLELKNNSTALCIVAHPDDETIWMGGTMARHKNVKWTIFVLCRESDPDRMPKFRKVAKDYFNANGIICDFEDEGIMSIKESLVEIQKIIRKRLGKKKFDYIFTHGPKGDYGHPRHIGVHRAVKKMIADKKLIGKEVYYFAYEQKLIARNATPDPKAKFFVDLSKSEYKTKRNIIKEWYGFSKMSFENRSCSRREAFNK